MERILQFLLSGRHSTRFHRTFPVVSHLPESSALVICQALPGSTALFDWKHFVLIVWTAVVLQDRELSQLVHYHPLGSAAAVAPMRGL